MFFRGLQYVYHNKHKYNKCKKSKKNPSLALKHAEKDPVLVLKGNEPNTVLVHIDKYAKIYGGSHPKLEAKSANVIMQFLNLKHKRDFRAAMLKLLLEIGLLKETIPD